MSFASDLDNFNKKLAGNMELMVKGIVRDVAETIIEMSPIGDASYWQTPAPKGYTGGRFRGNWDYGFNSAPNNIYDVVDKSGTMSKARIEAGYTGKKMAGNIHFLANNLPYAQALENGHSRRQAPYGMVKLTVIKFQGIVDRQARKIK